MTGGSGLRRPRASNFGTPVDLGIAELSSSFPDFPSEIIFTPAPGYEAPLVSFMRSRGTSAINNASFRLLDPNVSEVYTLDVNNNPLAKVIASVNSDFYASPITFQYGATLSLGLTRVDDILLEIRSVPEPSTFSMLLGVAVLGLRSTRGLMLALPRGR